MRSEHIWKSELSGVIKGLIEMKRASGFKYEAESRILRQFDSYCSREGYTGIHLTQEMVEEYIYEPGFRPCTYRKREKTLKELGIYAKDMGYDVYVPGLKTEVRSSNHVPYIFSGSELVRIFASIDAQRLSDFTDAAIVDPVLFRMLYATGLRISEALGLKCSDVDLDSGVLDVCTAKSEGRRLIPFCESLGESLKSYMDVMSIDSGDDRYFFPGRDGGRRMLDKSTIYRRLRGHLHSADIPHFRGGPSIHSFRHGFAVGCLKKWARENKDLTTCMPYLAAYMGHSDLRATQYYLRLTSDLYPEIIEAVESQFGYVIPGGEVHGSQW